MPMLVLPPDDGVPQRVVVASRTDIVPAVLALLQRAKRAVRCIERDLAPFDLAQIATVDALHALLHASRQARARLLVDDATWLDTRAARLRLLQRQFSHAIELRAASTDDPVGEDAALIVDHAHVLVLARSQHGVGEIWLNSEPRVTPLVTAFDRRWDAAAHNLPVDPLGL